MAAFALKAALHPSSKFPPQGAVLSAQLGEWLDLAERALLGSFPSFGFFRDSLETAALLQRKVSRIAEVAQCLRCAVGFFWKNKGLYLITCIGHYALCMGADRVGWACQTGLAAGARARRGTGPERFVFFKVGKPPQEGTKSN